MDVAGGEIRCPPGDDNVVGTGHGHWSTIDSAFIAAGALFAGNYFGGQIAVLAEEIANRPYFGGVIPNQDTNTIYMVVNADGTFGYGA